MDTYRRLKSGEKKHVRVGDKDTQQRIKKQLEKVTVGYTQRILPVETHGGVLVYSRSEWFSSGRDTLYFSSLSLSLVPLLLLVADSPLNKTE